MDAMDGMEDAVEDKLTGIVMLILSMNLMLFAIWGKLREIASKL